MYHVPLNFLCVYGCSDEIGENGDGVDGKDLIYGGEERVETTWPLVCR